MSKYGVIFGPYFRVFRLNTEIYEVNLRIQYEYRKIPTRNNSVFGHIPRSVTLSVSILIQALLFLKNPKYTQTSIKNIPTEFLNRIQFTRVLVSFY